jgi:sorbitol-specific phosphotransferase system component IIBC
MANKSNALKTAETTTETATAEAPKYVIKDLLETHKTKSAVIRFLHAQGMKRGDIVKVFTDGGVKMIYQHVRNVLVTPPKKA